MREDGCISVNLLGESKPHSLGEDCSNLDHTDNSKTKSTFYQPSLDYEYKPLLPVLQNKGLSISCHVAANVLKSIGLIESIYKNIYVLDARFTYEYENGHILGASNVVDFEAFLKLFGSRVEELSGPKTCFIVHCEFSSKRGPNLITEIRHWDRICNRHFYPRVYFPELYLLEGGYREFYALYPHFCYPRDYVEMKDSRFEAEYKLHKKKTKFLCRSNSLLPSYQSYENPTSPYSINIHRHHSESCIDLLKRHSKHSHSWPPNNHFDNLEDLKSENHNNPNTPDISMNNHQLLSKLFTNPDSSRFHPPPIFAISNCITSTITSIEDAQVLFAANGTNSSIDESHLDHIKNSCHLIKTTSSM